MEEEDVLNYDEDVDEQSNPTLCSDETCLLSNLIKTSFQNESDLSLDLTEFYKSFNYRAIYINENVPKLSTNIETPQRCVVHLFDYCLQKSAQSR